MANDQAALDAAIQTLGTEITAIGTSITTAVTSINAAIAKLQSSGGTTSVDLTNEVTALQSMAAALTTHQQNLDTAEASLKGPAGA